MELGVLIRGVACLRPEPTLLYSTCLTSMQVDFVKPGEITRPLTCLLLPDLVIDAPPDDTITSMQFSPSSANHLLVSSWDSVSHAVPSIQGKPKGHSRK